MSQHLSFPVLREGSRRTSQGQNRTREIRPSGIAGGPMEPWAMGAGLRPVGKPSDRPPDPNAVARHRSIPTALCSVFSHCRPAAQTKTQYFREDPYSEAGACHSGKR
jgi:hypothetical protein